MKPDTMTSQEPRPLLRIRIPPIDETEFAPTTWAKDEDEDEEEDYVCCLDCGDHAPPTYWGDFCSRSCYIAWCFGDEEDE